MVSITKKDLERLKNYSNFNDYKNKKAIFNTKFANDFHHNGEVVEVVGLLKGKDIYNDRYIIRFNDGTINDNIYTHEIDFNYHERNATNYKERTR